MMHPEQIQEKDPAKKIIENIMFFHSFESLLKPYLVTERPHSIFYIMTWLLRPSPWVSSLIKGCGNGSFNHLTLPFWSVKK